MSYLAMRELESEAITIIREGVAQSQHPVMLYSAGKDSSVMLHLAYKAFYPAGIPFPILHIDTGYKFPEMYDFRDRMALKYKVKLLIERNELAISQKAHPDLLGRDICCQQLKTQALLTALTKHGFDVAFGGARRDEDKSRAKERIFSVRDAQGQWDPRLQRPEIWQLYNGHLKQGHSLRVFPLSNWTERDIWNYIQAENLPIVSLYLAKHGQRYRSLGCQPCTQAMGSEAQNIGEIIEELAQTQSSERALRMIDHTHAFAMEHKKREGYF